MEDGDKDRSKSEIKVLIQTKAEKSEGMSNLNN